MDHSIEQPVFPHIERAPGDYDLPPGCGIFQITFANKKTLFFGVLPGGICTRLCASLEAAAALVCDLMEELLADEEWVREVVQTLRDQLEQLEARINAHHVGKVKI